MYEYPVVEDYNDLERYKVFRDLHVVAYVAMGLSAVGL